MLPTIHTHYMLFPGESSQTSSSPTSASSKTVCESITDGASIAVSYSSLYTAITQCLHTEHTTLLLYLLMHNNTNFRSVTLLRSNTNDERLAGIFNKNVAFTLFLVATAAIGGTYVVVLVTLY